MTIGIHNKLVEYFLTIAHLVGSHHLLPELSNQHLSLSHEIGIIFVANIAAVHTVHNAIHHILIQVFEVGQHGIAILKVCLLIQVKLDLLALQHAVQDVFLEDNSVSLLELVVILVDLLGIVSPMDVLGMVELTGDVDGSVLGEIGRLLLKVLLDYGFCHCWSGFLGLM